MTPRISIIIPVYNVERYIEECLQSVANQTIASQLECIIVDDCGSDKSLEVAKQFVNVYQGLAVGDIGITYRIIEREQNGGLSAARNTGIREAKGEYLYLLDSDDTIVPTAMEHLLAIADKHGGVDLLPALYITDGHGMNQFGAHSFPEFSDDRSLIKRSLLDYDKIPVTAANRLIRREFFLEHNLWFKEGIIHEDNYWTFFLAKHVQRMAFTPEKVYFYRTTEGSITTKVNIQKKTFAFKTMITDFSANIDSFENGAQKRLILFLVLMMVNNGYYNAEEDCEDLVSIFAKKNRWFERIVLKSALASDKDSKLYSKLVNILQRLYTI